MPLLPQSKILAEVDKVHAKDDWLTFVKPISKNDLKFGRGAIQHLPNDIITNPERKIEADDGDNSPIMRFGKYKGRTHDYVKKNDASYWLWLKENVAAFSNS